MDSRLEADVELESIAPPFRKFLDTMEVIDVWPTSVGQLLYMYVYYVCAMRYALRSRNNFEIRKFRKKYIRKDVRTTHTYIYIEKISIRITSVGLASARPNYYTGTTPYISY